MVSGTEFIEASPNTSLIPNGEKTKQKPAKGKPSSAMSAGKGKGKKAVDVPPPVKKDTSLRRRGEEDGINKYIVILSHYDTRPLYLVILSHYEDLYFITIYEDLYFINIECYSPTMKIYILLILSDTRPLISPTIIEMENQRKKTVDKSLEVFWKYLEPILNSDRPGSKLSEVARLQCSIKEHVCLPDSIEGDLEVSTRTVD
ncbi:Hypothetical predicted protein [Pelobates cultripes]|uniref:Uncharacterized protein n=1 Tax=Pelobates cultripes TaxID=61616 RepID=A0AAD1QX64_PELCU|nr:Hypothetical predicted protein [Pelobates cultripes]